MVGRLLKLAEDNLSAQKTHKGSVGSTDETIDKLWNILVVDGDQVVHDVTNLILSKYQFEHKPVCVTHAYSAREAQTLIEKQNDFAVIILDVMIETEHAGLDLVNYIRKVIKNQLVRIILSTRQVGQAPQFSMIVDYDINDYKEKSELTFEKLHACVTAALRSYRDLQTIYQLAVSKEELQEEMVKRNEELQKINERLEGEVKGRKCLERQLSSMNDKLESIVDNAGVLISLKNIDGTYDLVNLVFKRELGLIASDILGKTDEDVFPKKIAALIKKSDSEVLATRKIIQYEEIIPLPIGERIFLSVKFPLFDDEGEPYRICCIRTDVTDKLRAQNEVLHLAQYDTLTDLPNRTLFIDRLAQAIARVRWRQRHIAVFFLDLDRFKVINDTLGHDTGDKLLVKVAERLSLTVREGDSVCRLGGDEFAVLLTDVAHDTDIIRVADKIRLSVSKPYLINNREISITPSIGISRCPLDGQNVQVLLKKADIAMYDAKKAGKNSYRFYLQEDDSRANEQLSLEFDIRKMLSQGQDQLFLLYQPKVNFLNGDFTSVEALIRWRHPQKGVIFPADFISIMEDTGLILEVGEWVLKRACQFAVRCEQKGRPTRVAVNLSSKQFKQQDLTQKLARILKETNCRPQWLELEMTEASLVDDIEYTKNILEEISRMGIRLAIDDFGTGYSSMSYLKSLPFNTLKIDRSFIVDAPKLKQDRAIVTTIAQLAYNLNMAIVAEGVETEEQYEVLKSIMASNYNNQIQGYIFSKPVLEEELEVVTKNIGKTWKMINEKISNKNKC